jgi:hypothetical protein
MARIDDNTEEKLSNARNRRRQSRECPLLIRDDGMLFPNVPLVAKKQNFRPYRGDPKASLAERMRYLQGFSQRRQVVFNPEADAAPFELGKATADEIVAFAMEEYGAVLDAAKPLPDLRQECYRLSMLPEMELPAAQADTPSLPPPTGMAAAEEPRRRGRPPGSARTSA